MEDYDKLVEGLKNYKIIGIDELLKELEPLECIIGEFSKKSNELQEELQKQVNKIYKEYEL